MLVIDPPAAPADGPRATVHRGFIAGCYRDGALSDGWTDVTRCAGGTFTAYVPTCCCGWHGSPERPDARGADRGLAQLAEHVAEHLAP